MNLLIYVSNLLLNLSTTKMSTLLPLCFTAKLDYHRTFPTCSNSETTLFCVAFCFLLFLGLQCLPKLISKFRSFTSPDLFLTKSMEFFLNGAELSLNSADLINHWNITWAWFEDPVSHMCLAGTMVASWSLNQEMAGSSPFNDKYFLKTFSKKL